MKRSQANLVLDLEPAPDILKSIVDENKPIKVAFALETDNGEKEALRKMKDKKTDFIILNYANEDGAGFDSNTNHVTIFNKNGQSCEFKKDRKDRIAKKIIEYILKN
jgi:phosphopantothenoylcysteine decarboxylase/phosphopantothenate--cysteine ligase